MVLNIARKSVVALTLGVALTAGHSAQAQEKWDMPNEYNESSLHAAAQKRFADVLHQKTSGAITISHHFGGSIGYKSQDQYDAVGDGALPIANTNITTLGGIDPYFLLSSLPFLVRSADEARTLWETAKPVYAEIFDQDNQVLLYASPWTPAGLWSKTPINDVADFEKLKVRTWDANGTRTLINAKTSAVQLNWGDVIPQLATGGIDAVLTSSEGGANAKFWEHLTYFTPLNYSMSLNVTHMNKDVFKSLTKEQQNAVLEAAKEAEALGWKEVVERQEQNYVDMKANGVTIANVTPADVLDRLADAAKPISESWIKQTGSQGVNTLQAYQKAVGRN